MEQVQMLRDMIVSVDVEVPDSWVENFATCYAPIGAVFDGWENIIREGVAGTPVADYLAAGDDFLKFNISAHSHRLPLMNPFHAFFLAALYLLALLFFRITDRFTPNLKENALFKVVQIFHNLFLVVLSSYMSFEILRQALILNYNLWLNGVVSTPAGWPMAKIIWIFYVSKVYEFLDTIFMCLRKNWTQVSFLHVYHHCTIFTIWWLTVFMAPGGEAWFSSSLNSFVHVIMYSYYFCTTLKIPFPLKFYITYFQMFQFFLNFVQGVLGVVVGVKGFPTVLCWVLFVYMTTLLALFYNFMTKAKKRAALAKKNAANAKNKKQK